MRLDTEYSGYKDFGGVQFPLRIVQKQDGFPSLDLTVTALTANPRTGVTPPAEATNASPQFATVSRLRRWRTASSG
jgi:hypothetical protein